MKYRTYITSHGGNIRRNNEDNGYLARVYRKKDDCFSWNYEKKTKHRLLAAVFDGMGGISNGEIASRIAAEELLLFDRHKFTERVNQFVQNTNKKICAYSEGSKMGTTFVALSIEEDYYYFSNMGDSRGYLYRNGNLKQITKDHNMVREMYLCGVLSLEQAKSHPGRHAIYQFLGMPEEDGEMLILEPYMGEDIKAQAGDICLLCSDGLTDMVEDDKIAAILSGKGSVIEKAECLKKAALDNGGRDNITIILVEAI